MALLDAWTSAAATSLAKSVSAGTDRLLVVVIGASKPLCPFGIY